MTYEKKLNELLDAIFGRSGHLTLEQLATKADLHVSTVYKLNNRVTKLPRLKTVFQLAKAVGMSIELAAKKIKADGSKAAPKEPQKAGKAVEL